MFDFSSVAEVRLSQGKHASPQEGMCLMEVVAWFAGEPHSDRPDCVCPVLATFGIGINDAMDDRSRDRLLKPLVGLFVGTRGTLRDQARRANFLSSFCRGISWEECVADDRDERLTPEQVRQAEEALLNAAGEDAALTAQLCVQLAGWDHAVTGIKEAILLGPNELAFPEPVARERHESLRSLVAAGS